MLFNSYEFILLFVPITFFAFFWIAKGSHRLAALWLAATSIFFYGWWNPKFVLLLIISISFNYGMGYAIGHAKEKRAAKTILVWAIVVNLACLGYYKYTNFFISTVNAVADTHWSIADIALPLGVSFFTFTQIAFLVDVYRGVAKEYNFIHYILFITYFPHLIAGPVLHHKQMMPQFGAAETYSISDRNVAAGLMFFAIGLAKKVLLADSFAEYATPLFDAAEKGTQPGFAVAWTAALAYTLQIYFDFSGYSDMAIGASRLFGIRLPINFNSPYKATNIIDFWRRWHMTLSAFLRDYLYIPLGGNRQGPIRRHANLMATMLLGGMWHGASWTFIAWGGLHGAYLVINHAWCALRGKHGDGSVVPQWLGNALGLVLTFLAVVVAWVFFRAETFDGASRIIQGMARLDELTSLFGASAASLDAIFSGYMVPQDPLPYFIGLFGIGLLIAWTFPNSQELMDRITLDGEALRYLSIGALLFVIFVLAAISASRGTSEFIYFNF